MELKRLLDIIIRRKWLIAICMGVMVVLPMLLTFLIRPIYEVTGKVLIDVQTLTPTFITDVPNDAGKFSYIDGENVIPTFEALLSSASPNESVIKKMNLKDSDGKPLHINNFVNAGITTLLRYGKGMEIEQDKDSESFNITGRSRNVKEAAEIANNLMDAFMDFYTEMTRAEIMSAVTVLEKRYNDTRVSLTEKENQKMAFMVDNNVLDIASQKSEVVSQISSTETDIYELEKTNTENKKKYKVLKAELENLPEFRKNSFSVQTNSLVDNYKAQILSLEMERAENMVSLTEEHPTIKQIDERLSEIKATLSQEAMRVDGTESMGRNDYYDSMVQDVMDIEINFKLADLKRQVLDTRLEELKKKQIRLSELDLQLARMQREVDNTSSLMEAYRGDLNWAKTALEIVAPNIRVFQKAEVLGDNIKKYKYFPNRKLILVLSVFLGFFATMFLVLVIDYVDQTYREESDLRQAIGGLPVLGRIPCFCKKNGVTMEPFWALLSSIRASGLKTLCVTSPASGDGRSMTAAGMADAAASSGLKTLLVDASVGSSAIAGKTGIAGKKGFYQWLASKGPLDEFISQSMSQGVDVMASGMADTSGTMKHLSVESVEEMEALALKAGYDLVIFDTPALESGPSALIIASALEGALVLATRYKNTPAQIERAIADLALRKATVSGIALNRVG